VPISGAEPQLQQVEHSLTVALLRAFPDAADRSKKKIKSGTNLLNKDLSILQLTEFNHKRKVLRNV